MTDSDIVEALEGRVKILPYKDYGTKSSKYGTVNFTIDSIAVDCAKPIRVYLSAAQDTATVRILLPSGGTYIVDGDKYSGGAVFATVTGDDNDGSPIERHLEFSGWIVRIS